MGNLLSQIQTTPVNAGGKKSTIDALIESMTGDDRADLVCALRNLTISPTVIARVLRDNGMAVSRSAILRWRDRECA